MNFPCAERFRKPTIHLAICKPTAIPFTQYNNQRDIISGKDSWYMDAIGQ